MFGRALEYARLAMGFANVRVSRYGLRECSGGYSSTNAGAGAGLGGLVGLRESHSVEEKAARKERSKREYQRELEQQVEDARCACAPA